VTIRNGGEINTFSGTFNPADVGGEVDLVTFFEVK